MPSISTDTRVILWIVAAIAGGLSGIIGDVLAINIVHIFSKRGRPPTKRPLYIWIMFYAGLVVSIGFGAFAAFAPTLPAEIGNSLSVTSTPSYSSDDIRLVPTGDQIIVAKLGSQPILSGDVIPLNRTVTVIFNLLNNGTSPITIKAVVIGSRGPGVNCDNKNVDKWSAPDNPFPTATNIAIQPGKQYEYQGTRAYYLPGKYFLEPIIQGPNGDWGGIQPFSCISINVK